MVDLGVAQACLPALAGVGVNGSPSAGADGDPQLDQALRTDVEALGPADRPAEPTVIVPHLGVALDHPLEEFGQVRIRHQSKLAISLVGLVMRPVYATVVTLPDSSMGDGEELGTRSQR